MRKVEKDSIQLLSQPRRLTPRVHLVEPSSRSFPRSLSWNVL
jgi:hypothetical protein